jgi:hypothetical protein
MSPEDFIQLFEVNIGKSHVSSFSEKEIGRKIDSFGKILHVFSSYETTMRIKDTIINRRGINSIQLFYDSGRWRISGILWDDERLDNPIPDRFLELKNN